MEVITNHLSIVQKWFYDDKTLKTLKTLSVGKTEVGNWIVADDDIEVATLVVVRYMLKHNYKFIGQIHLHIHENENESYTLYYKRTQ